MKLMHIITCRHSRLLDATADFKAAVREQFASTFLGLAAAHT